MPELVKKCYGPLGDSCQEELTHASQDPNGQPIALCGSCASRHRHQTRQPIRVLGTTDWVKPEPATIDPNEPVSGFVPTYPNDLPSVGNDPGADE